MAIILSIETSTMVCSAALHHDGELIASKETHTPQSAASQLAIQIEALLSENAIDKKNVSAVAVSSGPGSYTGLRIGVATAKGLCFGWNVPLIAIDSLSVLALALTHVDRKTILCPMIDARRMEVYCCLLDATLNLLTPIEARIIDTDSFSKELAEGRVAFFGDGAAKCRAVIQHPNAQFEDGVFASAASMGKKAFSKFQAAEFEALASFEPFYLKEFVAKTKSV